MTALLPSARVLLIRLSALGDVVFALETLASLKAERADVRCDFLIEDRFASLLEGHPQIERVLVFPRRQKTALPRALRELRAVRYDAVLDLQGNLKSALHARLARAARRLGYAKPASREGASLLYGERVTVPGEPRHRAERGYALLQALGLSGAPARPVLPRPPRPAEPWSGAGRPRVVLHPGVSAFGAFKSWPLASHAELAERLLARGVTVAVSYGPGEDRLADAVRAKAPTARPLRGAELGLVGLAAAYAEADVVVAADTGPLHLAAAAGTPVVALYGPKDPALYGPRGPGHVVLTHDVPCRPCNLRWCPAPLCVRGVEPAEVEAAVLTILAAGATR